MTTHQEPTNNPREFEYTDKPELKYLLEKYDNTKIGKFPRVPTFELMGKKERKQLLSKVGDKFDMGALESGQYYKLMDSTGKSPTLYFEALAEDIDSITLIPLNLNHNPYVEHFFRGDIVKNPKTMGDFPNIPIFKDLKEIAIKPPNVFTTDPSNLPVIIGAPRDNEGLTLGKMGK